MISWCQEGGEADESVPKRRSYNSQSYGVGLQSMILGKYSFGIGIDSVTRATVGRGHWQNKSRAQDHARVEQVEP
jgi:hypothetical protein